MGFGIPDGSVWLRDVLRWLRRNPHLLGRRLGLRLRRRLGVVNDIVHRRSSRHPLGLFYRRWSLLGRSLRLLTMGSWRRLPLLTLRWLPLRRLWLLLSDLRRRLVCLLVLSDTPENVPHFLLHCFGLRFRAYLGSVDYRLGGRRLCIWSGPGVRLPD